MTVAKRRASIESFGPELLAALVKGSREPVTVKVPYRTAIALTQRLNKLRYIMQHKGHSLYSIVARVKITTAWGERAGLPPADEVRSRKNVARPVDPEAPSVLTLSPHDSEFTDALRAAGVAPVELRDDPIEEISPTPTIEDLLANLGDGVSAKIE